ncbi:MAG: pyridoxamine 5'-phosphate oxidase family protein, partial [Nitrosopumilaceae archaeon]|nr:pyridoxamine 5'-phosphate oxidase family protein [Nitrosopumilaceae archaeon]
NKLSQSTIQRPNYQEFFEVVTPLRFSTMTPSGYPSIISLWYLYRDGKIYCATQKNAKVVSYIKQNNKCAFEITTGHFPYKGIRGHGKVTLREDIAIEILNSLIDRFIGNKESYLSRYLLKRKNDEVALEITPKKLFPWDYSKRMSK